MGLSMVEELTILLQQELTRATQNGFKVETSPILIPNNQLSPRFQPIPLPEKKNSYTRWTEEEHRLFVSQF